MGVIFPRLNRADARGYHGNIGVAGCDPRIASVEHRIESDMASDVSARCRTLPSVSKIELVRRAISPLEIGQLALRRCATGSVTM